MLFILFTRKIAVKNISDKKEIESNVRIISNRIQVAKPFELQPSIGCTTPLEKHAVRQETFPHTLPEENWREVQKSTNVDGVRARESDMDERDQRTDKKETILPSACKVKDALEKDEIITSER